MDSAVSEKYGNKLRIRVCGLCFDEERLLLVNHRMNEVSSFWAPPGGGVEFGETLDSALKREFREETGLEIDVQRFSFGCEYIRTPLHAIELFYEVTAIGGMLKVGYDPELQLIQGAKFLSLAEIGQFEDGEKHGIFKFANSANHLKLLTGFYSI
jgi:8-oxo-dGTP diphosphatase